MVNTHIHTYNVTANNYNFQDCEAYSMIFLAYRVSYFTLLHQLVSYVVSCDLQDDDGQSIKELSGKSGQYNLHKTNTGIHLDDMTKNSINFSRYISPYAGNNARDALLQPQTATVD